MEDRRKRGRWVSIVASGAVLALAVVLVAMLPHLVGATWSAIGLSLSDVPALTMFALAALWFAGLLVHVPVQVAAMPGLRARQALTLNLSGSAVSNVLPFGGPAGMGLGFAMARSWGFGAHRFASYTVSTNLWNAFGKFGASLVILAAAGLFGLGLPSGLGPIVVSATVFMALAAGVGVLVFSTERSTGACGRVLDRLVHRLRPHSTPGAVLLWLVGSRRELVTAVRRGWRTMSLGVLAYLALQAVLLGACLTAVGAGATLPVVAVAFAIERLISLAPFTPGAAGVAELGTVAALHSFGVDPVAAAAGVLLYRILMFALEIPVGGVLALVWARRRRAQGDDVSHDLAELAVLGGPDDPRELVA
jgi:uncharacterized membrane protein YbhN (UPF0104 family)